MFAFGENGDLNLAGCPPTALEPHLTASPQTQTPLAAPLQLL